MINLVDRMDRKCFDEIRPIFDRIRSWEMDSRFGEAEMAVILERHKVAQAEGLAMYLASVCSGICHEPVKETGPQEERRWWKWTGDLYLETRRIIELRNAMCGNK